jgi:hypothetical protein
MPLRLGEVQETGPRSPGGQPPRHAKRGFSFFQITNVKRARGVHAITLERIKVLVEALVTQMPIEVLDKAIVGRFSWRDVADDHAGIATQ